MRDISIFSRVLSFSYAFLTYADSVKRPLPGGQSYIDIPAETVYKLVKAHLEIEPKKKLLKEICQEAMEVPLAEGLCDCYIWSFAHAVFHIAEEHMALGSNPITIQNLTKPH